MKEILEKLMNGSISMSEAEDELKVMQVQQLGDNVKFDTDREDRIGVPEAVYSQGKTDEDLLNIINNIENCGNKSK